MNVGPRPSFHVLTWNVNGIRSLQTGDNSQSLKVVLNHLEADIVCFQETKVSRDMLDESIAFVEGYNSYFSFSRIKAGYSGVVTYCKDSATPVKAEEGLTGFLSPPNGSDNVGSYHEEMSSVFSQSELKDLDYEGRAIITQHQVNVPEEQLHDGSSNPQTWNIINVYCPRVDPDKPDRLTYKLNFLRLLELRAKALIEAGSQVIIVGDLNISHQEIDRCETVDKDDFESNPSRQWLNSVLLQADQTTSTVETRARTSNTVHCKSPAERCTNEASNLNSHSNIASTKLDTTPFLIDIFRLLHKDQQGAYTCWNTRCNARSTNYGSRIDYVLACAGASPLVMDCKILSEIEGSDHCPVSATFKGKFLSGFKCPSQCSKYFPEFLGKQVKITTMLKKRGSSVLTTTSDKDPCALDGRLSGCRTQSFLQSEETLKRKKQLKLDTFFSAPNKNDTILEMNCSENIISLNSDIKPVVKENAAALLWKKVLNNPISIPVCNGHKEPCIERTVKKKGPNLNRKFWACARGVGRAENSSSNCNFFLWKSQHKKLS